MSYRVLFLNEAREDIKEAISYYHSLMPDLAKRFRQDLKSIVFLLQKRPKTFGFRYQAFRTVNLQVFPYQLHYQIDEKRHQVVVFAVLHGYRDPDFIKQHIK